MVRVTGCCLVLMFACSPLLGAGRLLPGWGEISYTAQECVTPQMRAAIDRARRQSKGFGGVAGAPAPFAFFPMAGNRNNDTFTGSFVDLDPDFGEWLDFECTQFTRDTHGGIDTGIRSFGEQVIGVPVFAAADGMVVFAQDGFPDMNLSGGSGGNIVAIDHGFGRETSYFHLRNGSVTVSVGAMVTAGQQIGMVASSGNSFGPHLHFEVQDNGAVYEPFAGDCRPGPTGWVDQEENNTALYLSDFGFWHEDVSTVPPLPNMLPREGQIGLDDEALYFWTQGHNLPPMSDWRIELRRPNGTLFDFAEFEFFNADFWRDHAFPWSFPTPDAVGTWTVVVIFNGEEMVEAPIEVRTTRTPDFNRPPAPITVAFDPPAPIAEDVVFCRVNTSVLLDDLDYDIVRYRYVWKVDDVVVRDVTTAAQSDAIARNTAAPGDTLRCEVTPNDGTVDGAMTFVEVVIGDEVIPGDLNRDGCVGQSDLGILLAAFMLNANGDLNGDMMTTQQDLGILLANFGQGCI